MRAQQQLEKWLIILSVLALLTACQPAQLPSAPSAAAVSMAPLARAEFTAEAESALLPAAGAQTSSGVYLTAQISPMCVGTVQPDTWCVQPYRGEFVVTTLNGAEVTHVMTNDQGQAMVALPPGRYVVGVRTENIYPWAPPVVVNVPADRYVFISFSLDSGLRWQPQRR